MNGPLDALDRSSFNLTGFSKINFKKKKMAEGRGEQFGDTRRTESYIYPEWTLTTGFSTLCASPVNRGRKFDFVIYINHQKAFMCPIQ